jgi:hypothetical protein
LQQYVPAKINDVKVAFATHSQVILFGPECKAADSTETEIQHPVLPTHEVEDCDIPVGGYSSSDGAGGRNLLVSRSLQRPQLVPGRTVNRYRLSIASGEIEPILGEFAVHRVDQTIRADGSACVGDKHRQDCFLFPPTEIETIAGIEDFDWPENSYFHG